MLWSAIAVGAQQVPECKLSETYATLVQTVQDRSTRVPLRGALVTAGWTGNPQPIHVRTDSLGQARICAPPGRMINLRIAYRGLRTTHTALLALGRTTENTVSLDVPGFLVRGTVVEHGNGAPVRNAAVRLANTPLATFTDAAGRFAFDHVPVGDYALRVEHLAYAAVVSSVNVLDQDLDARVLLSPEPIPLAPVVVTAFSRKLERTGFYERAKRGIGTFIGRRQIDAMNVQRASDLLRNVPSARLIPQPTRRNVPPNLTLGRGDCRFRFLVDGSRTLSDFEMDFMAPYAIEGVEIYNGMAEVPAAFKAIAGPESGSPLCGVVAIWTREGR